MPPSFSIPKATKIIKQVKYLGKDEPVQVTGSFGILKMITRRGVCYELDKSPYFIQFSGILFYFSSKQHLHKFEQGIIDDVFYNPISSSLSRRTRSLVKFFWIDLIGFYRLIETRGFYIKIEGSVASCPEHLKFTDHVQIK